MCAGNLQGRLQKDLVFHSVTSVLVLHSGGEHCTLCAHQCDYRPLPCMPVMLEIHKGKDTHEVEVFLLDTRISVIL